MDLSGNVRNIISAALKRFLQRDNSHKNYICMSGFVCISLIIYTSLLFLFHSEEKGCGLSSFECEDEGVYTDVNDRSPNHEERAQDAPLSSLWRKRRDSNPRGREPKRFSRPPRYDHFDTLPYSRFVKFYHKALPLAIALSKVFVPEL